MTTPSGWYLYDASGPEWGWRRDLGGGLVLRLGTRGRSGEGPTSVSLVRDRVYLSDLGHVYGAYGEDGEPTAAGLSHADERWERLRVAVSVTDG